MPHSTRPGTRRLPRQRASSRTVAVIDRHVLDQHTHVGERCKRRYCRDDNSLGEGRDQSGQIPAEGRELLLSRL
jgi:hypothetical protein